MTTGGESLATAEPPWDWAALYQKHRDAMYGVAYEVLRGSGRTDLAADAVQDAMVSLMRTPPSEAPRSWEALLVATSKRRALDMIRSAAMRTGVEYSDEHLSGLPLADEDDVLDRLEKIARARPVIAGLDAREHEVLAQYIVLDRPRTEVAELLKVTSARISQISTDVLSRIEAALKEGK